MLHRKTIIKKTMQIGFLTQISRLLGMARELLMIRYLGIGILSDAFITAFKVPNSLRKIFAEGALSTVLVPAIVKQEHTNALSKFMTGAFILFEGLCALIVFIGMMYATPFIHFIAPGFSPEQKTITSSLLLLLMPFIFFVSTSSLLSGALQSKGKFLIPAFGPAFFNIVFLISIGICMYFNLPVSTLCLLILGCAFLQSLMICLTYFYYGLSFSLIDQATVPYLKNMFWQFLLCWPSVSFSEINLFIDTTFASLLDPGAISLLYYANRFMGIPLGVIIGSLTTVLLPQFSRIALHSKKRLTFYVFESVKVVLWITIPVMILMICTSYHLFYTLFLSPSFTIEHVEKAAHVLQAFCLGLPFLALNRLFLNVLYAMHKTNVPPFVSALAVLVNVIGNTLFLDKFKITGLAFATSLSAFFQMIFLIGALHYYKCPLSIKKCAVFLAKYMIQLLAVGLPLLFIYFAIKTFLYENGFAFILNTRFGFWYIALPFCGLYIIFLWALRKKAKLHLFFID